MSGKSDKVDTKAAKTKAARAGRILPRRRPVPTKIRKGGSHTVAAPKGTTTPEG